MEIKAKFENGVCNLYDIKRGAIGKIKIDTSTHFNQSEITINNIVYKLVRDKWETTIIDNGNKIFDLKTNSFSGNTEIKELNKKIKGVWGLKWGTQLTDEEGKTLLKIRNEKKSIDNGHYILELENENLRPLEILIALYGHLLGSSLKQKGVLTAIIAGSAM